MLFNRDGSTLAVMDDLQIAIHSYDGCSKGCAGCIVDTHFKKQRFQNILSKDKMNIIHQRVTEYYQWARENLNTKDSGYFGKNGYQINHFSYTFRFGNHSELPMEELLEISHTMDAPFKVFSTAPTDDIQKFSELSKPHNNPSDSRFFLEIIYDPVIDDPLYIRQMILEMRKHNILGYPEVLITRKLLQKYPTGKEFVEKCVAPIGDIETQMQFGRYTPSKTRRFSPKQLVSLDEEVVWLAEVAKWILNYKLKIHPIPIAEYAVTFLDEYEEHKALKPDGKGVDEALIDELDEEEFNIENIINKTRDIFMSSLYIDHDLQIYVWSESMGQHVLDKNFGFEALGNIKDKPIHEILTNPDGLLEKMLKDNTRHLLSNRKCASCRYKSFCSSHAIPLFRKFMNDDGKHCYGYIPVIREFQKDVPFLQDMIDGFKRLGF